MSEDEVAAEEPSEVARLPKHLAALIDALEGSDDLGGNHDAYLTFSSDETESGGAASA